MPPNNRSKTASVFAILFIGVLALFGILYKFTITGVVGIITTPTPRPTLTQTLISLPLPVVTITQSPITATTQIPTITTPQSAPAWWEVYFTDPIHVKDPNNIAGSIEDILIQKINAAQTSIHIASFEFDLTPVADALVAAYNRGVDVRWVTDDENGLGVDAEPRHGQFDALQKAGIQVRSDNRSALMHNKFWIFDGQTVWTGSTNITVNGIFKQDNNTIVIHSPDVAVMYEREFAEMWDGKFGPKSPSTVDLQSTNVDGTNIQVLFSSEDHVVENIIALVKTARTSIRFLAFSFTDYPLADSMRTRAQAGVDVRGLWETVGSDTEASELRTLYCAKIPVRQDGNPQFMHNKFIVIDRRIVITGSLNYSSSADDSNDENVIILDNPDIATLYLQDFERVWGQGHDPDPAKFPCK